MKNTNHTPGPWTYRKNANSGYVGAYIGRKRLGYEIDSTVCTMNKQTGNVEANARLIAAAPELLEALKLAVEHYVGAGRNSSNVNGAAGTAADIIHAAIAKAEGK